MSDWNTEYIGFEPSVRETLMVKPPFLLVGISGGVALLSALFLLGDRSNSSYGYLISVFASIAGGFTSLTDQKRRGDSNYMSYDWFPWLLIAIRYLVALIAVLHIVRLAIQAASGGKFL